jgi:excisionase family DNA binding protein
LTFLTLFGTHLVDNSIKYEKTGRISMPLMKNDDVFTTEEAIRYLKISRPTFLKYIHRGRIKAIKAGKGWRVLGSELYRFLQGDESQWNRL